MRRDLYEEMYRQESYYWWHVGKRGLVKALLKEFTGLRKKSLKILDVGCGTGMMMKELSENSEIWGLDNDPLALKFCQKRGFTNFKNGDLEKKLPFKDKSFEIVLCLDVLEHLRDEKLPVKEFFRILKPKGFLVVTVPAYPALMSRWDLVCGHQRRYTQEGIKRLLGEVGFAPRKTSYTNFFSLLPAILVRFLKSNFQKENYSSDFLDLPPWLNRFLLGLAKVEKRIIIKANLPAGLSLICLAQKNGQAKK